MRLLLVLLVVLAGVWLWRSNRKSRSEFVPRRPEPSPQALEMVGCRLCSVHVALVDAVQGKKGLYCCLDHRQQAEP
ncbi:MAG: PP0621 family protein [Comamonadaceae bacterium]|jgi:uncharacterized protein